MNTNKDTRILSESDSNACSAGTLVSCRKRIMQIFAPRVLFYGKVGVWILLKRVRAACIQGCQIIISAEQMQTLSMSTLLNDVLMPHATAIGYYLMDYIDR